MFVDYLYKVLFVNRKKSLYFWWLGPITSTPERTWGKEVFYEYLRTGDKMFAIVKQKHKIAVKEAKTKKNKV